MKTSKISSFDSVPLTMIFLNGSIPLDHYSTWSRETGEAAFGLHISTRKYIQRVLGRQDFCWTAGSCHYWVWDRIFEFQNETCRWRLYGSKRGPTLEIEFKEFSGNGLEQAGIVGLNHFLKTWNMGVEKLSVR